MASKKQRKGRQKTRRQASKPIDRRVRQARVAQDAPGVRAGDLLVGLSVAELSGAGEVWFYETLVPYMLLVDARRDERQAIQALARARKSRERRSNGTIRISDSNAIVEAQRLGTLTCIIAMTALEAFAAEVLPSDAAYEPEKGRKAGKALDREGIQWLSAEERFGEALPGVLGVESIKQHQDLWIPFKRALTIRNATIHPTNEHLHSMGRLNPKRLSSRILAEEFVGTAAMTEGVMEHYSPGYISTIDNRY
jgi:hypothetical protein